MLRVPTQDEALRVKAYLITVRNRVRDFLDVAALSERHGVHGCAQVLLALDDYYEDQRAASGQAGGVTDQLLRQLSDPLPSDSRVTSELHRYKGLSPRWHEWDAVRAQCSALAAAMLDGGDR